MDLESGKGKRKAKKKKRKEQASVKIEGEKGRREEGGRENPVDRCSCRDRFPTPHRISSAGRAMGLPSLRPALLSHSLCIVR